MQIEEIDLSAVPANMRRNRTPSRYTLEATALKTAQEYINQWLANNVLDHSRLSDSGSGAVAFKNISTPGQAQTYAASGFHASVKAGLKATKKAVKALWNDAAKQYLAVYESDDSFDDKIVALSAANTAASKARTFAASQGGGGSGGSTATTPTPEPDLTTDDDGKKTTFFVKHKSKLAGIGLLAAGLVGIWALNRQSRKKNYASSM